MMGSGILHLFFMKLIPLTKGRFATVDDEDYQWLNQWKWHCESLGYAVRRYTLNDYKIVRMHRLIMNTPKGMECDHINGNKLDNRKVNLRNCSHQENARNQHKYKVRSSKYKGVSQCIREGKWQVYVGRQFIGYFENERWAAMAYDINAKALFGEFAHTNF